MTVDTSEQQVDNDLSSGHESAYVVVGGFPWLALETTLPNCRLLQGTCSRCPDRWSPGAASTTPSPAGGDCVHSSVALRRRYGPPMVSVPISRGSRRLRSAPTARPHPPTAPGNPLLAVDIGRFVRALTCCGGGCGRGRKPWSGEAPQSDVPGGCFVVVPRGRGGRVYGVEPRGAPSWERARASVAASELAPLPAGRYQLALNLVSCGRGSVCVGESFSAVRR